MEYTEEILCIARYMGLEPKEGVAASTGKKFYFYNCPKAKDYEPLPYYNEWNDLMPVVEKINKRDWVTIFADSCRIHSLTVGEFDTIEIASEGEPLIKVVFKAVHKYCTLFTEPLFKVGEFVILDNRHKVKITEISPKGMFFRVTDGEDTWEVMSSRFTKIKV
jgi:hypothetical protein